MNSIQKTARAAGLLYLVFAAAGFFSLLYVPSQVIAGDPSTTASRIMASESLFRTGIIAELFGFTIFVVLPFLLYRLLSPVDRGAAALMVTFALVSVPISFVAVINKFDILSLLDAARHLHSLPADRLQARVTQSLDAYGNGLFVSEIFWGLWLLPFGYLVYKSGFLPRVFGILLMVGCFGYLIDFAGRTLSDGYAQAAFARFVRMPGSIGELGTCLWLLIVGVREPIRSGD